MELPSESWGDNLVASTGRMLSLVPTHSECSTHLHFYPLTPAPLPSCLISVTAPPGLQARVPPSSLSPAVSVPVRPFSPPLWSVASLLQTHCFQPTYSTATGDFF